MFYIHTIHKFTHKEFQFHVHAGTLPGTRFHAFTRKKNPFHVFKKEKRAVHAFTQTTGRDQTQPDEVKNIIRSIDTGKATGPYRILLDLTSTP